MERDEEESEGQREVGDTGRGWKGQRMRKAERGKRKRTGSGVIRGGWFQLGGSNSPGHCSFHSRFVFPVCLFPSHLR